jgi:hypothetical protein
LRYDYFQQVAKIAYSKKTLLPPDINHETFLGQDLSDPLEDRIESAEHLPYTAAEKSTSFYLLSSLVPSLLSTALKICSTLLSNVRQAGPTASGHGEKVCIFYLDGKGEQNSREVDSTLPLLFWQVTLSRLLVSHKIPIESQRKWQPALAAFVDF